MDQYGLQIAYLRALEFKYRDKNIDLTELNRELEGLQKKPDVE